MCVDLLGELGLTARRVAGYDVALEHEQFQQDAVGGDLVRLRLGGNLPEHHAFAACPSANEIQCGQSLGGFW